MSSVNLSDLGRDSWAPDGHIVQLTPCFQPVRCWKRDHSDGDAVPGLLTYRTERIRGCCFKSLCSEQFLMQQQTTNAVTNLYCLRWHWFGAGDRVRNSTDTALPSGNLFSDHGGVPIVEKCGPSRPESGCPGFKFCLCLLPPGQYWANHLGFLCPSLLICQTMTKVVL